MHRIVRASVSRSINIKQHQQRTIHISARRSSAMTSAALYAVTASPARITAAAPEDVKELSHHVKNGKGFRNPWPSFAAFKPAQFLPILFWYVQDWFYVIRHSGGSIDGRSCAGDSFPVQETHQIPRLQPFRCRHLPFYLPARRASYARHGLGTLATSSSSPADSASSSTQSLRRDAPHYQ